MICPFVFTATFRDSDVMNLARALRQLFDSSCSSLTDLSISVLSYPELIEILLCAIPSLTSLCVEIETMMCGPHLQPHHYETSDLSGATKVLSNPSNIYKWAGHKVIYIGKLTESFLEHWKKYFALYHLSFHHPYGNIEAAAGVFIICWSAVFFCLGQKMARIHYFKVIAFWQKQDSRKIWIIFYPQS